MKKILFIMMAVLCGTNIFGKGDRSLISPDGNVKVNIYVGKTIRYDVTYRDSLVVSSSDISMKIYGKNWYGVNSILKKVKKSSHSSVIDSPFYKKSSVTDNYNQLTFLFSDFRLVFRVYDGGVAYRFISGSDKDFIVEKENAGYVFPHDVKAYVPYVRDEGESIEQQFFNSFENTYRHIKINEMDSSRLAFLPVAVEVGGLKVCITESDLENYPGMYLINYNHSDTLSAVFAPYPGTTRQGGHNMLQRLVTSREPYIAKCAAGAEFPWRIVCIGRSASDLLNDDMVYRLASPNIIGDYSWVKPGKVAWDWWNDWGLFGVDFKVGINTKTYKAFIDFASANHIEYVILDEGWAVNKKADLFRIISQINLPEIINYGKQKGVGIILWAGYYAFDRDMEKVCRHYSEMGVKGFKIDFMNADDQQMVDFETRAAATCAKYKLLVDFHGTYKPAGINRTYPNVLNFEGVNGLEQMKWASLKEDDQVTYDETVPFIRMLAGPIDYTQGAMRNATKRNYRYIYSEPMSQGTRCHQLAEYVIFFSPLCMLCDSPSNYEREQECTDFISGVPTVWDETVPLKSEIGKYVGIARRKGDVWYLGVTNNWDARDISLKLSFLKGGRVYDAVVFEDGANADRIAMDYVKRTAEVSSDTDLKIHLAPGGGIAVKLTEVKR